MNKIEKLELKHLCGYLPHGLKCKVESNYDEWIKELVLTIHSITGYQRTIRNNMRYDDRRIIQFVEEVFTCPFIWEIKPLLLPLSALTEPLSDGTVPIVEFFILYGGGVSDSAKKYWKKDFVDNILYSPIEAISFGVVEKLLEWHFDIYGLIDAGLAIDKRTVKN